MFKWLFSFLKRKDKKSKKKDKVKKEEISQEESVLYTIPYFHVD